jgi:uncharacterized SAM-binding protein YcdF (DUF218 family)
MALGVLVGGWLLREVPARWLVVRDAPRTVDAAVVLAGDPDYERTHMACSIVLAGEARLLVLTGGYGWLGDHAGSLKIVALERGVPEERIVLETVSTSTREEMLELAPVLRRLGVRSVALVTSPYHQRRAYWAARAAWNGIEIVNRPAEPSSWSPEHWWQRRRDRGIVWSENLKIAYYGLRGWIW